MGKISTRTAVESMSDVKYYKMDVVVFAGLCTGQYDQIMRWWNSSLGQGSLQSLTLFLVFM